MKNVTRPRKNSTGKLTRKKRVRGEQHNKIDTWVRRKHMRFKKYAADNEVRNSATNKLVLLNENLKNSCDSCRTTTRGSSSINLPVK